MLFRSSNGYIKFYVHPALVSGETMDYEVAGNNIAPLITEHDVAAFMAEDVKLSEDDRKMLKEFDISKIIQKCKLEMDVRDARLILLVDWILAANKAHPDMPVSKLARVLPALMRFAQAAMVESAPDGGKEGK